MLKVKTITSKRQTDFENQIERFLDHISENYGIVHDIHYAIATDNKDTLRSALIIYEDEPTN